jgi:hypothetical protein
MSGYTAPVTTLDGCRDGSEDGPNAHLITASAHAIISAVAFAQMSRLFQEMPPLHFWGR